jgi:hypothetical protein
MIKSCLAVPKEGEGLGAPNEVQNVLKDVRIRIHVVGSVWLNNRMTAG